MSRPILRRGLAPLLAVASLVAAPAFAFEQKRSTTGAKLAPGTPNVWIALVDQVPGVPDGGRRALDAATATWSAIPCTAMRTRTTKPEESTTFGVVVVNEGWKWGNDAAAHTELDVDARRGEIKGGEIQLNGSYRFADGTMAQDGVVDLESLFVHEIGHLVGLDHSHDLTANMAGGVLPGELRRKLTADDVSGICHIMPKGIEAPPTFRRAAAAGGALFVVGVNALAIWVGRKKRRTTTSPAKDA